MKTTILHCKYCHTEFIARRIDAKFCSAACKQQAYLERMKMPDISTQNFLSETIAIPKEYVNFSSQLHQSYEIILPQKQAVVVKEEVVTVSNEGPTTQAINHINSQLRECLNQLVEFDKQEQGTLLFRVNGLLENIIAIKNDSNYKKLPYDYPYLAFIERLITKSNNWYQSIKYSKDRRVKIVLSADLMDEIKPILAKIDR